MRTVRRERQRQARKERRARVEKLAEAMTAPEAPLVWGAGWRGRVTGAAMAVVFVVLDYPPGRASLAHPQPGPLAQALWAWVVFAVPCCWFALWRITADRDGVYIRRMWSTRFLPWSRINHVEMRPDAQLGFIGPGTEPKVAGLFAPPWLIRATGRFGTGAQAADTLTAMAQHSHLRPTAQAGQALTAGGVARWAALLAPVLFLAGGFLHY
ncbi:hypothetical protein [Streptomyces colonosanans]|uniref:PH domain-containing protein n=1 Tax=Streptomyces colonosanans TaxID=1428652 RepID=A0A1S2Q0K0_9ACTN|nr:hypothetical protein [Streptomyces colonosanans]OIJ99200.1 hypothetical protein BIV24_05350 [Streptomyces colonosanans]